MSVREKEAGENNLPTGWVWLTIGDIATYVSRGRAPKYVDKDGIPIINQRCIRWRGIEWQYIKFTDSESANQLAFEQFLQDGDVLWNSTGTGTIGRATVFSSKSKLGKMLVDTHVTIIRLAGYAPQLLKLWISSNAVQKNLDRMQIGSTNQVELSRSQVLSTPIPVPPTNEQHRIVAKLNELFSSIEKGEENLKRAQALVKRYRQSVLKAAVTGELTRDWREKNADRGESGADLLQRILAARHEAWEKAELEKMKARRKPPKDDKWKRKYKEPKPPETGSLPELPEGWVWASVDQVTRLVQYGTSAKCSANLEGVPVLRMGNIVDGSLSFEALKYLPHDHGEFPGLLLNKGDLLFNRTNSAELVGKSAVYDGQFPACSFASYLIRVKPLVVDAKWLMFFVNSVFGRGWIANVKSQQVGQANVNGSKLKALAIPLPPVEEYTLIIERVEEQLTLSDAILSAIASEYTRVRTLCQSVLDAAFSGKLVPQDPNDEPASVLLERIAAERANREARPKRRRRKKAREATA